MKKSIRMMVSLLVIVVMMSSFAVIAHGQDPVEPEKGVELNMVLLPKFLGILVFDQANEGAMEAHAELENP
ncbi:MAG TPA: hypothetical protein VJZ27_17510, partial [Aggregatilineales bacterium]|nr:hypothetical protein [Aggregatilineales bacterium]